jgi:hypothetical protein
MNGLYDYARAQVQSRVSERGCASTGRNEKYGILHFSIFVNDRHKRTTIETLNSRGHGMPMKNRRRRVRESKIETLLQ